jgi:hypothetical protein
VPDLCQYVVTGQMSAREQDERELTSSHLARIAVYKGGRQGILIVQVTQSITILGGGAGYMLAANNYLAELVPAEERTGAFGVLQVSFGPRSTFASDFLD